MFEAVAGEGEGDLIGMRIPSSTGIAGWVLVTGQPIVIDDLQQDPRFARQAAERTGYVPKGLMAVPLVNGETVLGVLQVLDRAKDRAFSLGEIDLLILFANQAAIGSTCCKRPAVHGRSPSTAKAVRPSSPGSRPCSDCR